MEVRLQPALPEAGGADSEQVPEGIRPQATQPRGRGDLKLLNQNLWIVPSKEPCVSLAQPKDCTLSYTGVVVVFASVVSSTYLSSSRCVTIWDKTKLISS